MTRHLMPEGYTVTQLENGKWYPVQVSRYYNHWYPEGYNGLELFTEDHQEVCFAKRADAVAYCQHDAQVSAWMEQKRWEGQRACSDLYPEHYAHCEEVIEILTGTTPIVTISWDVNVFVLGYTCSHGTYHSFVLVDAPTKEEALLEAANRVYENAVACGCLDEQGKPMRRQVA